MSKVHEYAFNNEQDPIKQIYDSSLLNPLSSSLLLSALWVEYANTHVVSFRYSSCYYQLIIQMFLFAFVIMHPSKIFVEPQALSR